MSLFSQLPVEKTYREVVSLLELGGMNLKKRLKAELDVGSLTEEIKGALVSEKNHEITEQHMGR